jgi:hypothetical protein
MNKCAAACLAMAGFWCGQSMAQSATPLSETELSKDTENPVTRRITLPVRYQADFNDGAYKATKDTFEIDQAVVPFRLNEDWSLITRTKLPAEALPPKKLGDHWAFGVSNPRAAVQHNARMLQHCLNKQTLGRRDCRALECHGR